MDLVYTVNVMPLLDNDYTGGDNVDVIYQKDAKNVVYNSYATVWL